jgi:hypothetical protein
MTIPSMSKLSTVFPIMIDKYEQFIPNIEGMGVPDKINAIIQYLNRIGKLSNDVVADWNKVMVWVMDEGLTDNVNSKIDDMVSKGTFDTLLNGMFDDINNANTAFQATVNSSLAESAKVVEVESYLLQVPEIDDTARIQRAINDAIAKNRKLVFGGIKYYISNTLTISASMIWEGLGWGRKNSSQNGVYTAIIRNTDVVGVKAIGGSVIGGGTHLYNVDFRGIMFNGNGFVSDMVQLWCGSFFNMYNCRFYSCGGVAISAKELMDSFFSNIFFESCGSSDGTKPAILLQSGSGYENTNNLYFQNIDFESCSGKLISSTVSAGYNTNNIRMNHIKMENHQSNQPFIDLNTVYGFTLKNGLLAGTGTQGNTISSMINLLNCEMVDIDVDMYHWANVIGTSNPGAGLTTYINANNVIGLDVFIRLYNGIDSGLTGSYAVTTTNCDPKKTKIRVIPIASNSVNKPHHNQTYDQMMKSIGFRSSYNQDGLVSFQNDDINPADVWQLGRVIADGSGTAFRFIRNLNGVDTVLYTIDNTNTFNHLKDVNFKAGSVFANLAIAPFGTNGSKYYDSNVNAERTYINGSWHRIGYATAMPSTGTWTAGDIVYNSNPSVLGSAGSQYVLHGWRRLTTGSANVLNVDWVEMRMVTGS